MKKYFNLNSMVALFAATTLFACTQDATEGIDSQTVEANAMNELPLQRTYEEALAIAQEAADLFDKNGSATRINQSRTITPSNVQLITSNSSTRNASTSDTLMYVFNYDNNAGFAVVSANRATEGLIAVTEQGNYIAGEEENGGFNLYMDMAKTYVENETRASIVGPVEITQYRTEETIDTLTVGPYLNVRWGQDWPYNLSCPTISGQRTKAGCVATAIAQIMTYYQHPNSFTVTYAPVVYEQTLGWNYILDHKYTEDSNDENCTQCSASGSHPLIASLIRQIGEHVQMEYDVDASGCDSEMFARSAFQTFGYSCGNYQTYSSGVVKSSLMKRQLVYMRGGISSNEGHAWVIDGYRRITKVIKEYIKPKGSPVWEELSSTTTETYYNHINWGWDGDSNGYFSVNVFNTAIPKDLDPEVNLSGTNYNFTIDLSIIPNISKN